MNDNNNPFNSYDQPYDAQDAENAAPIVRASHTLDNYSWDTPAPDTPITQDVPDYAAPAPAAQQFEPVQQPEPIQYPDFVEQPAQYPDYAEQPAQYPEYTQQPAQYPESVEQPVQYPDPVEEPTADLAAQAPPVVDDDAPEGEQPDEVAVIVDPPYPGHVLTAGSPYQSEVARMQKYLNLIASTLYRSLPQITVDGKYGSITANDVTQYQRLVGLTADGKIGPSTWNSIVSNYNMIAGGSEQTYPGIALRPGMRSSDVRYAQIWLNSLADHYTAINHETVDGVYGDNMTHAVRLFQMQFGLSNDGILGANTWAKLVTVFNEWNAGIHTRVSTAYPGYNLSQGSSGDSVRCIQSYLNTVRAAGGYSWPVLAIDGQFGSNTKLAVQGFQRSVPINADGIVGSTTWNSLIAAFNSVI